MKLTFVIRRYHKAAVKIDSNINTQLCISIPECNAPWNREVSENKASEGS